MARDGPFLFGAVKLLFGHKNSYGRGGVGYRERHWNRMKTRLVMVFKTLKDEAERTEFLDELLQAVDVILSGEKGSPQNLLQSPPPPDAPDPQFFLN